MARTSIDSTYMLPSSDGAAEPTAVAADTTNGNVFTNDGQITLVVENAATASGSVTFPFPAYKDVDGVALPDKTASVPASGRIYVRLPVAYYGDQAAVDGTADMSFFLIR